MSFGYKPLHAILQKVNTVKVRAIGGGRGNITVR